jgi:GntR family transcriptional regulator
MATGRRLPSEHELAQTYEVSPETVRRALAQLAGDGLVEKIHGRGTFVLPPAPHEAMRAEIALESLFGVGERFPADLLSVEWRQAPPNVMAALRLTEGQKVFELVRLRRELSSPVSVSKNYFPPALGKAIEPYITPPAVQTLIHAVEEYGRVRVDSAKEIIEASVADYEIAKFLRVPFGLAILAASRTYFCGRKPLYYGEYFWRGDRFRIVATLQRGEGPQSSGNGEHPVHAGKEKVLR